MTNSEKKQLEQKILSVIRLLNMPITAGITPIPDILKVQKAYAILAEILEECDYNE